MSQADNAVSAEKPVAPGSWPVLDAQERRILGVLVEKAKTTPEAYPMSVNGLVAGCNQKSNRDPLMNLSDLDVEETLSRLQKKGLVSRVVTSSSRVDKWRHLLYDVWKLDKLDMAVLAELLLRGPQTEGELRSRASRLESFADLEQLRAVLKPMAERKLVVYLTPEGRRGTTVTHGFHDPKELERLKTKSTIESEETPTAQAASAAPASHAPEWPARQAEALDIIARLTNEVTRLSSLVEQLRWANETLTAQMKEVRQGLGLP